MLIFLVGKYIR